VQQPEADYREDLVAAVSEDIDDHRSSRFFLLIDQTTLPAGSYRPELFLRKVRILSAK
jgi:hypothetical protein